MEDPASATVHFAPPEPLDWADFGGYRYLPIDNERAPRDDLDVLEFVDAFKAARHRPLELADLRKRLRVVSLSAASGQVAHHWTAYDTIVAELEIGDERYVLSAGDWFAVDNTFAQKTAAMVNALPTSAITFPTSPKGEAEAAYLERAVPLLRATTDCSRQVRCPSEWRHRGDLEFEPWEVALWLCPADEIDAFTTEVREKTEEREQAWAALQWEPPPHGPPGVIDDPRWGLEQIIAHLIGHGRDVTPFGPR